MCLSAPSFAAVEQEEEVLSVERIQGVLTVTGTGADESVSVWRDFLSGSLIVEVDPSQSLRAHSSTCRTLWADPFTYSRFSCGGLADPDGFIPINISMNSGNDVVQFYGRTGFDYYPVFPRGTVNGGIGNDKVIFKQTETTMHEVSFAGGIGEDTVDYSSSSNGVTVRLDNSIGDGRAQDRDNIHSDVENVYGSKHDDVIWGSVSDNDLIGGPGADVLHGLEGADTLRADGSVVGEAPAARDILYCGPNPTLWFAKDIADVNDSSDIPYDCEDVA